MNKLTVFPLATLLCVLSACLNQAPETAIPTPCTEAWYQSVESAIPSGDGMGHGPDIGSEEWKSVIEFKLGMRGNPDIPDRHSLAWCAYIDGFIK
jgi:hypothetical protein